MREGVPAAVAEHWLPLAAPALGAGLAPGRLCWEAASEGPTKARGHEYGPGRAGE